MTTLIDKGKCLCSSIPPLRKVLLIIQHSYKTNKEPNNQKNPLQQWKIQNNSLSGIKVSAGNISIVFGALFNKGRQESLKVINIRRAETKPPFYYRQYNLLPRLMIVLEWIWAFSNMSQAQQSKIISKNVYQTYIMRYAKFYWRT